MHQTVFDFGSLGVVCVPAADGEVPRRRRLQTVEQACMRMHVHELSMLTLRACASHLLTADATCWCMPPCLSESKAI